MPIPAPDDADAWSVLADRLQEADDLRGEILVLEMHGESPEVIEDLLLLWWESRPELYTERFERLLRIHRHWAHLAGFGRLNRLAHTAAQVACALGQPDSEALLTQLSNEVVQGGLQAIDRAFDGVPPPDENDRTLRQAEAWDDYQTTDRSDDVLGRWQDLPESELYACPWATAHLGAQGLRHYLPAMMSLELRHLFDPEYLPPWPVDLVFTLSPHRGELAEHQQRRFSLWTPDQVSATAAFAILVPAEPRSLSAWLRAAVAEPGQDWIEILQRRA